MQLEVASVNQRVERLTFEENKKTEHNLNI